LKDMKKVICILIFVILAAGCAGQGMQEDGLLISKSGNGAQKEGVTATGEVDPAYGTEEAVKSTDDEAGSDDLPDSKAGSLVSMIYVQVAGAVHKPGVYKLPEGSRVFQALELAGGVTADAQLKSLNQAAPVSDGEMIWVMTVEEAAAQPVQMGETSGNGSEGEDGKVNLNTATKEELMELPGIGAAKAASILAYREANGSFTKIEDLMKIEGIKEGVFSKIEDYVIVQ